MKKISRFYLAIISIIIALNGVSVYAETVEYNGVYYTLTGRGTRANVDKKPDGTKYSGDIVIPDSFVYSGKNVSVDGIADSVFTNSPELTSVKLNDKITRLSSGAFAWCQSLTSINLTNIQRLGNGAFKYCTELTSVDLSGFADEYEGELAFYFCSKLKTVTLSESLTTIPYGMFWGCVSLESINFPSTLTIINDYAFINCYKLTSPAFNEGLQSIGNETFNGIKELRIPSSLMSIGVFSNPLETITVAEGNEYFSVKGNSLYSKDGKTLYCAAQVIGNKEIKDETLETIMPKAYSLTAITSIELGNNFYKLGFDAFPNTLTSLSCKSIYPPIYYEPSGLVGNNEYINNCTLTVPLNSVDLYKKDPFWGQFKNIVGNKDWDKDNGVKSSLPPGLYFAQKDGNICYLRDGAIHDTGISAGANPFNIQTYDNAIYVADAGENYNYLYDITETMGDGSLYKVEKAGGKFVKTSLLYPQGHNGDPYTCWVDEIEGEIYVSNRTLGVYKFSVKDVNRYMTSDAPVFSTIQELPYYGSGVSYGASCKALQMSKDGVYWQAFGYMGSCIVRYKAEDIGTGTRNYPIVYGDFYAMYLDEDNGYLYAFAKNSNKTELRRVEIAKIDENLNFYDWELIDDAPDNIGKGFGFEVKQIAGDGKNIYWSYIADDEQADAGNPLHKSGIKMIPATGNPVVSYAVEGVEAYGLAIQTAEDSSVEDVENHNGVNDIMTVVAGGVKAIKNAEILIYGIDGRLCGAYTIKAGEVLTLSDYNSGLYVVKAVAEGSTQIEKVKVK